jgi:hypothetical protein
MATPVEYDGKPYVSNWLDYGTQLFGQISIFVCAIKDGTRKAKTSKTEID